MTIIIFTIDMLANKKMQVCLSKLAFILKFKLQLMAYLL